MLRWRIYTNALLITLWTSLGDQTFQTLGGGAGGKERSGDSFVFSAGILIGQSDSSSHMTR